MRFEKMAYRKERGSWEWEFRVDRQGRRAFQAFKGQKTHILGGSGRSGGPSALRGELLWIRDLAIQDVATKRGRVCQRSAQHNLRPGRRPGLRLRPEDARVAFRHGGGGR